jgi:hypothetical protein
MHAWGTDEAELDGTYEIFDWLWNRLQRAR